MIRIYFDWNVFSNIRNCSNEIFSAIKEFVENNYASVLLVYSPAHLQDLKRSYFNTKKGKIETELDLVFLEKLTRNHCLYYDFQEKAVTPKIKSPQEYFKEIYIDINTDQIIDFENIFDINDPLGKLWHFYLDFVNTIPSRIDFSELEKSPDGKLIIAEVFKNTKENNTFGSLLKDISIILQNPQAFEKAYKYIRLVTKKEMKINSDTSKWGNPFRYLDKILNNSQLQKTFFDLTNDIIKKSSKKAGRFDYFVNYYIQLDMFGFHMDKRLPNLIDDATHSFYGAHTDIFVTDDDNTNKKSKALYEQLNIITEVIYSDEFFTTMRRKKLFLEEKSILEQVEYIIENSLLLLNAVDNELNPSRVYKIEPLLLDYFNRMQISEYQNSRALIFYKKQGNYSNFLFWTEIRSVVDKFSLQFGKDMNDNLNFDKSDESEVSENKWIGRHWKINNIDLYINYIDYPFGLTFKIDIKKPNRQQYRI